MEPAVIDALPSPSIMPEWMTYEETAAYCRVSKRTLFRYLKSPDCALKPRAIFSMCPRINRHELERVMKNQPFYRYSARTKSAPRDFTSLAPLDSDKIAPSREIKSGK